MVSPTSSATHSAFRITYGAAFYQHKVDRWSIVRSMHFTLAHMPNTAIKVKMTPTLGPFTVGLFMQLVLMPEA